MGNTYVESNSVGEGFRVTIKEKGKSRGSQRLKVVGHLPEEFSIAVGSEISSPFANFAREGTAAKMLAYFTGISNKVGVTTTKLFMGPEQPDLSLDIEFVAYYNATTEVLAPCIKLLTMAAPTAKDGFKQVKRLLRKLSVIEDTTIDTASSFAGINRATDGNRDDLIKYLKTPSTCTISFGDTFQLDSVYLSNVSVTFSSVLDNNNIPMRATASLTITPSEPLNKGSLARAFDYKIRG